jgi:hypothetical protein
MIMKKYFVVALSILMAVFLMTDPSVAQGKKKKKKKKAKTTKVVAAEPVAPAAPVEPEEQVRVVPYDSIDYNKTGYNPLSILQIHRSRIMHKMRVRRLIDFNEKCNTPFINTNQEFMHFLLEGLRKGEIQGYNDSLDHTVTKKSLKETIHYEDPNNKDINVDLKGKDLGYVYMDEDIIFDRQRSQTRYDILSFTLKLPPNTFEGQYPPYEKAIATVRYKDVERYMDAIPMARWKNPYNNAEDRKISDAFRLRLFCGHITRLNYDNPTGSDIAGILSYTNNGNDPERGPLLQSRVFEELLVSKENELYDY